MGTKLTKLDEGRTQDALSIAWASTYIGRKMTISDFRVGIENEIAASMSMQQPYYDAWLEALRTFLPGTGLSFHEDAKGGTIYVATELVVRGHVPLDEILAVAALCFAGSDPKKPGSYL